jgi:hypothetical protein
MLAYVKNSTFIHLIALKFILDEEITLVEYIRGNSSVPKAESF